MVFSDMQAVLGAKPVALGARRERSALSRPAMVVPSRRALSLTVTAGKQFGENLEERIANGEFDDSGSTKEKLTRPVRKVLAKDPVGPGE